MKTTFLPRAAAILAVSFLCFLASSPAHAENATMPSSTPSQAPKASIANVKNFENIDSDLSHLKAIRCVLEYHGQTVDWDWLLGASGEAFCYYYHPDGTHLTQFVHSWDIANSALSLYGYGGQWRAASPGNDIAPAWSALASELAAGRLIIAPGIMPYWNGINSRCDHWYIVTGLDPAAGKVTILGAPAPGSADAPFETPLPTGDAAQPYPQGPHPCWYGILRQIEPGKNTGHYGPDKPMMTVARLGPPMEPKSAALAALKRAVQLAHEPPVTAQTGWGKGTYLAGLAALQRLHDDLLAAQGNGLDEYQQLNPTKDEPFAGLKPEIANLRLLAARRHAAAGFLKQAAQLLPDAQASLLAAAEPYEQSATHAQAAFDVCFKSEADWLKNQALEQGDQDASHHIGWRNYHRQAARLLADPANRKALADHLAAILTAEKSALTQIEKALADLNDSTTQPAASPPVPKLSTEKHAAVITGYETLPIGTKEQQNTVMISMSAALRAVGQDVSYEYLMGVSGLAFRIQLFQPGWCPSSPHAHCGFNAQDAANQATAYEFVGFDIKKDDPASIDQARAKILASIDRGLPVLMGSEETGLIVGYRYGGQRLVCRPPYTQDDGYVAMKDWPWGIGLLQKRTESPDQPQLLRASLQRALDLSAAENFGPYAAGFHAFDLWITQLRDADRFAAMDETAFKAAMHANAYIYYCLIDARRCAAAYLTQIAGNFDAPAAAHLRAAAQTYTQLADALSQPCPTEIAPMPRMLQPGQAWTQEMRHRQAQILAQARDLDRQALAEIQAALAQAK
ncbi:MAG: hypothetical protein IT443_05350 [Phycisphaeraceae bacterium]|nr:hypothetical protein [Phycisphaeraceae bacterium]